MQFVVLVFISLFFLWWQGERAAIASCFGSFIAVANTLLQRWYLIQAATQAKSDAGKNLRKAYRCIVERWLLTIVMFAVGFGVLAFLPLPLIVGFTITQVALLFGNTN
jgi:ATP synthase protein I